MRFFIGLVLALALGVMGCSETAGTGGSAGDGGAAGDGGSGGAVSCMDSVCPCTEGGIRAAIAEGGGPFTFDCGDEPATVTTRATIVIDNDVILDGEGHLTVDGDDAHTVFLIYGAVELRGFAVTGGGGKVETSVKQATPDGTIGGILNDGTLMLTNSTVSGNSSGDVGGILNLGNLTLTNSTVSGNTGTVASIGGYGGIFNLRDLTLTNSTVSGNTGTRVGGIRNDETLTLINSTVSGNMTSNPETAEARSIANGLEATLTLANSLIDGDCSNEGVLTSNGYNIESDGDTCGFDQGTDQVNVSADDLKLGPLADNGGPTETHALGEGSFAIDQIPAVDCVDADGEPLTTDQRGFPRDSMCDVGAFEWIVTDCTGEETFTPCTYDGGDAWCWLEQCAAFDCSDLEDGTYCEFAVLGDGTKGVCEAGKCTKPQDCTGLVDGWDCNVGGEDGGICENGECVRPP